MHENKNLYFCWCQLYYYMCNSQYAPSVLGHISLPSQSLLEARDVNNILITQVPHFLNLYCKIQTLTFSTHIYDLHPRAEKSRSIFTCAAWFTVRGIQELQHILVTDGSRFYRSFYSTPHGVYHNTPIRLPQIFISKLAQISVTNDDKNLKVMAYFESSILWIYLYVCDPQGLHILMSYLEQFNTILKLAFRGELIKAE